MNRIEKLLSGLDLSSVKAIEIGALDRPIVPPSTRGVFYVDFLDTPGLRERYKSDPNVNIDNIVHVSGIWGQKTLGEISSAVAPVDVVVASHVIEHVPDLISWLREIAGVLTTGGQVRLAIPDRRYTFDYARGETTIADVLAAHINKARVPQPRQVIDFAMHMAQVDCAKAWSAPLDVRSLKKGYTPEQAMLLAKEAAEGVYHDVHCWVFTPASFAALMAELARAGHIWLKCARYFETEPNTIEFFAFLQRCDDQSEVIESWEQMHSLIDEADRIKERAGVEERLHAIVGLQQHDALQRRLRLLHSKEMPR